MTRPTGKCPVCHCRISLLKLGGMAIGRHKSRATNPTLVDSTGACRGSNLQPVRGSQVTA